MSVYIMNPHDPVCSYDGLPLGYMHDEAAKEWNAFLAELGQAADFLATSEDTAHLAKAVVLATTMVRTHAMPECHPEALA